MENTKVLFEHPLITKMKLRNLPANSPAITVKDKEQPNQGYIARKLSFKEFVQTLQD